MSRNEGFVQYIVEEVMGDIHGVSSRGMFGGYGLYKDGVIFALIADDVLYFKVDESNRPDYEELDSKPFTYEAKGHKPMVMSYWEVPERVMENSEELALWIEKAVSVSRNSKKK